MTSGTVPQPLKEQSSISVTGGLLAAAPRLPQGERTLPVYVSSGAIHSVPLHEDVMGDVPKVLCRIRHGEGVPGQRYTPIVSLVGLLLDTDVIVSG